MSKFIQLYVKAMRPYLFFVTGIAGWLGILFTDISANISRQVIVLSILFLSWGLNQIMNDILGMREDKINAPHRPFASGELNKKHALILTFLLFLSGAVVTFFLNSYALIIYFSGFIFNIVYEYFKGIPLLGNIWFGIMIALAPFYGALAISNNSLSTVLHNQDLLYLALFVALVSSTMTFFTYFRDYLGDKKNDKKTLVVLMNPENARLLNFVFSLLPFLALSFIVYFKFWLVSLNLTFLILIFVSFIFCQYTAFLYFKNFKGEKTYDLLKYNFQGAVIFQVSFMALINPLLSVIVFVIVSILINSLFNYYRDPLG